MKKTLLFVTLISFFSLTSVFADDALLKAAESGDAEAQFKVAALYASGKIGNKTPEDREKMFGWLEKAAGQDFLKAQEILCKQYLDRCNYAGALKWAKKAMEQKSNTGKAVMAYLLYYGENVVPIDKIKAYSIIKDCESDPLAKSLLGDYYSEGWFDFEIDLDKAEELANEALKQKCTKAYGLLFSVYLKKCMADGNKDLLKTMRSKIDEGIKINPFDIELQIGKCMTQILFPESPEEPKKAVEILEKFDEKGNRLANALLSDYELNYNKNTKKALEHLEKAAEEYCSEYPFTLLNLYVMGEDSKGMKADKNPSKAREIALKAISFNNPKFLEKYIPIFKIAQRNEEFRKLMDASYIENFDCDKYVKIAADNGSAAMMYLYSKTAPDNKHKYLIGAANMGWADAQGDLAAIYYLEKNFEKSYYWAKKADDNLSNVGRSFLGFCIFQGLGNCQKNEEEGLKLILNSISRGSSFVSVTIPYRKYTEENTDNYHIYLLSQLYLIGIAPKKDIEQINSVKANIARSMTLLTKEDKEKADTRIKRIIKLHETAKKEIITNNLMNYGVVNF